MANRLAQTTSPYLLQHADNPVDWWPWPPEAFDEARRRGVPVLSRRCAHVSDDHALPAELDQSSRSEVKTITRVETWSASAAARASIAHSRPCSPTAS